MRTKSLINVWSLRLFVALVLNSFFWQYGAASESTKKVVLTGHWNKSSKSLRLPISASTDAQLLYIQNTSPNCDIAISIVSDNGDVLYKQELPASETSFMVIPLSELPAGSYQLELSNPLGGYLKGRFIISKGLISTI